MPKLLVNAFFRIFSTLFVFSVTLQGSELELVAKLPAETPPGNIAVGPDNYIYVTVNELHRSPGLNNGQNNSKGEFKVMRFKAISEAQPGR